MNELIIPFEEELATRHLAMYAISIMISAEERPDQDQDLQSIYDFITSQQKDGKEVKLSLPGMRLRLSV